MPMRVWIRRTVSAAVLLLAEVAGLMAAAGPAAAPAAATSVTVLDLEQGSFVGFARWKTPSVVTKDGKIVPLLEAPRKTGKEEDCRPWPVVAADPPPQNWASLDFDRTRSADWPRIRGPFLVAQGASGYGLAGTGGVTIYMPFGNPTEWGQFLLRGTFRVEDPGAVRDLRLLLHYLGGVVVYVNGRELCRGHLPPGAIDLDTLAERYPEEAYVRPDGQVYRAKDAKEFAERMSVRVRRLSSGAGKEGHVVPASMLRKGLNVMAIEAHAAPLSEHMYAYSSLNGDLMPWPHAGVQEARLVAAAGVEPKVGPSEAIQLWTSQPMETVEVWHYAHPAARVRPVVMVGARNGTFSGKVVLSSKNAIRDLTASVTDLVAATGDARIPASAIQVRFAEPAHVPVSWRNSDYWTNLFDRLLSEPPAEVAPRTASFGYGSKVRPAAAVAPIWLTVRVPADARPGDYRGVLTVEAAGTNRVKYAVPVELAVHDWRIPDYRDFTVHHNLYQSPDSVAQFYKVPMWSEKHFELMGKSLDVLAQVGNKICVVPLVEMGMSINNTQSMVRWIRKPGGAYDHDFSIMERYLDLYAAKCGKPGVLQLYVWETVPPKDKAPLAVTVLDPATGKIDRLTQPPYGTPENEAFWRPVLTEVRRRLEKRGWFDVAAVSNASYCYAPSKACVTLLKRIWPDGQWISSTHAFATSFPGTSAGDAMPVMCNEYVWGSGGPLYDPDQLDRKQGVYPRPWKPGKSGIVLSNVRAGSAMVSALRDGSPLSLYRTTSEAALQGNVRGIGRVGGDFWPVPAAKEGKFQFLCSSYGGCSMPENTLAMISPGPDGAIFNERMEAFREGVQVAEAIIFLQKAVESGKTDAALAARVEGLLNERARYYLRTRIPSATNRWSIECSNWQERDSRLFALAAETAKTIGHDEKKES
jgi:hypothetical protein